MSEVSMHPAMATAADAPFVYFIRAIPPDKSFVNNRVKIGTTSHCVTKRLAELKTMSPIHLGLMGVIPYADERMERVIHAKFASKRSHGEWFNLDAELDHFIYHHARRYEPYHGKTIDTPKEFKDFVRYAIATLGFERLVYASGIPEAAWREWSLGMHFPNPTTVLRLTDFLCLDAFMPWYTQAAQNEWDDDDE